MAKNFLSSKRLQIDKANSTVVIFVAVAAFVTAFSLVACKALISQSNYQSRVIKQKKIALNQLKANNQAAEKLVNSYKVFVGSPANIISGNSQGTGDRDGDNAKIVLDALPSKYDFPALATSLEKILSDKNYKIDAITGTDDELNQSSKSDAKLPIDMPFEIAISGNFASIESLVDVLQRSIRPIYISKIGLSGSDNQLTIRINAKTYYQPEKTISITTKVVK